MGKATAVEWLSMEYRAKQLWYPQKPKQSGMYSLQKQSPRISVSFVNFCDVFVTKLCSKTNVNVLLWTKFRVLKLLELNVRMFMAKAYFRDLVS